MISAARGLPALVLIGASVVALTACQGAGDVRVSGSVGMYYGTGYGAPWHYGPGYYPPPVIIVPPRPPSGRPPARPMPLPARPSIPRLR
jgi:hypothetical protein